MGPNPLILPNLFLPARTNLEQVNRGKKICAVSLFHSHVPANPSKDTLKAILTCVQDWRPTIDAVFPAENDTELTTLEIKRMAAATANSSHLKIRIYRQTLEQLPGEVIEVERDLLTTSKQLHRLNGIPSAVHLWTRLWSQRRNASFD